MSGLATSLRTEARRLRGLQAEVWRLETVTRIKLDEASRLSRALAIVEAEGRDAADGARNLRRSVRLRDGGGLTQRIEFLETQADAAEAADGLKRDAEHLDESGDERERVEPGRIEELERTLESAARLTADLFPDGGRRELLDACHELYTLLAGLLTDAQLDYRQPDGYTAQERLESIYSVITSEESRR